MFALVDCNNFYASCERAFNPALRLCPVVVLSNNDGCIIARSEEAKRLGILMGTPEFKCRLLLKQHDVAVFSSNYALYGDMSSRVMATLAALAPEIEVYSIDEAFLDMSSFSRFDLRDYARLMRKTVRQHTGIPVCVGMAPTKTLAKIANRLAKKNQHYQGVCVLATAAEIRAALLRTKVEDIWGIGRQWSKLLQAKRIESAADLAAASAAWVRKHLHIVGARIQAELQGTSCLPMELVRPAKQSICTSRSFGRNVSTLAEMQQAVATFAGKCAVKLRKEDSLASMLTVFIATSPFDESGNRYWGTRTAALRHPTQDSIAILRAAETMLAGIFRDGKVYKKAGVMVSGIVPRASCSTTLSLFAEEAPAPNERDGKIMQVMDSINLRYGGGAVRLAAENSESWKPHQERLSSRYTTRWSDIIEVRI
ncbi:MAG: Y-family DNA polymerase [Chlorobiaceae bacterium]|nr:Y-family DNA polymerase [Chlorobiaceae bacterium]